MQTEFIAIDVKLAAYLCKFSWSFLSSTTSSKFLQSVIDLFCRTLHITDRNLWMSAQRLSAKTVKLWQWTRLKAAPAKRYVHRKETSLKLQSHVMRNFLWSHKLLYLSLFLVQYYGTMLHKRWTSAAGITYACVEESWYLDNASKDQLFLSRVWTFFRIFIL